MKAKPSAVIRIGAKAAPCFVAALLLESAIGVASADTAVTGYSSPGNVLNPQGRPLYLPRDPDGLSQLDDVTRTPTGLLYPIPFQAPAMVQSKTEPDWWSTGWVQAGVMGTFGKNTGSAALNEYGDWKSGPLATNLGYLTENRKTAFYISAIAEDIGRSDEYYQLKLGRYGVFNVTSFFDSIPHTYSTTAKSIWDGVGTGNLTLKDGLVPGASTAANVTSVAGASTPTTLRVTREKAGSSLTYTPYEDLELFVQLSDEWREGTQPISATFGYPFENGATQLIQPIHYQTFDVTTALRYKEDDIQANLTYAGSFFRNGLSSLTWQNLGLSSLSPGAFIPTMGRLSLPPDNDYHTLKGDVAVLLSPKARFTASLSYSLMRQNDRLLPPTVDSGTINGVATAINLDQWNTIAALSQPRANAGINIFNAFAQFHYSVSPDFNVTFALRDRNEANLTNYVAFNPQTGQYGYIAIDGGLAPFNPLLSGVYEPNVPGSLVQIRNMPFANDKLELTAGASYRIDNHMKLDFSYADNMVAHSVREVPNSDDNVLRLQFDTMGYSWGTVRLSYEFARRIGSDYDSNPYTPYYSASLPGYVPASPAGDAPFALGDLRKFDVANRTEHTFHGQGNFILSTRTDLQLSADAKIDDYDAQYGLRSTTALDATASFNYQMSPLTSFTGYFTFQAQNRGVANINPTGTGTNAAAGSPAYPLANAWQEPVGSDNYTAGLSARHSWGKISLNADYTFTYSDSPVNYSYASTGAFFGLQTPAVAGNSFPDITFYSHTLETNLLWQYTPSLSYRLYYRLSYQNLADFHYDGLRAGALNNNYYLGVTPENYTAQTIGLLVQYVL
jgi:MtrB/PioB family decaheme-associated outer membrane protein